MAGFRSASVCTRVASLLMVFGFVTNLLAVSSPYWMEAHNELGSSHSGLFRICILGKCDEFIFHSLKGWFRMVQAFMMLSIFISLFGHIALALYIFLIALVVYRRRLLLASFLSIIVSAILILVSVIVYAVDEGTEISTLSWGFYMALISVLFHVCGGAVLGMEFGDTTIRPPDERFILQTQAAIVEVRESRSSSVLSVLASGQSPEQRPLNKTEVRMRSYSSSVNLPSTFGSPVEINTPPSHPNSAGLSSDRTFSFDKLAINA